MRDTRRRTRSINTNALLYLSLLGIVGFAFLLGIAANSNPEKQALQIEEMEAILPWKIASRITGHIVFGIVAKVGAFVLGGFGVYYLMRIALNWLDTRARLINQKNGVFPLVRADNGALYDPNRAVGDHPFITLAALEVQKTAALPRSEKTIIRTTQKAPKLPPADDLPMLTSVNLPDLVRLPDVCQHPTLNTLTLGIAETGTLTASLFDLMHVLSVGASGFGKSAFLRMLIWQLAQVPEDIGIVAIDINGSEFNLIRQWSRLLYPVARDTRSAIATLNAVSSELERRKGLYEQQPTAYDLPSYNRLATPALPPIAVLVDEGTNLLNQNGIGDPLRAVTQVARQYGIYLLLAGQSAKARVIDTQTRDNFSTRLCFHTSPASYRAVLGQSVDDVTDKGRAWAQITGAPLQQIQTPYVTRQEVEAVLTVGEPRHTLDVTPTGAPAVDNRIQQVIALKAEGESDTAIARKVYGHGTTHYIDKVRAILQQQQQNHTVYA